VQTIHLEQKFQRKQAAEIILERPRFYSGIASLLAIRQAKQQKIFFILVPYSLHHPTQRPPPWNHMGRPLKNI